MTDSIIVPPVEIPTEPSTAEKTGKASVEAFSAILIATGTSIALTGQSNGDSKTMLIGVGIGVIGVVCYFLREFKIKGITLKSFWKK